MKFVMYSRQPSAVDVSINFGSTDIGVSEHFLNRAQIGTVGKQVSGETVAQGMRMDIFSYSRAESGIFDDGPDPFPVEFAGVVGYEKVW